MISRRDIAVGGLLSIVWNAIPCACHAWAAELELPPDCTLDDQQAGAVFASGGSQVGSIGRQNPVIVSSGDRELDYAVAQNLSHITDTFGVLPGFAYYDDGAAPNAFATKRQFLNRSDGTVFFGRVLLSRCLHAPESPDAVVSAVCAHEFGHVVQFKFNLQPRLLAGQANKKRVELNADFMAGYYAGRRKLERPTYPSAV